MPDVSYTYADAVREGVCRPVTFIPYDGTLQWRSGDDVIEAGFDTVLTGREASRRYRTAISTELPDGLPRILAAAHERLDGLRAGGHRDAGGLVVAADTDHAREIAKLLRAVTGKAPTVVLHTEARAAQKLAAFTASRDEWIVAVNMVSEGVDIPRLRVGVYATRRQDAADLPPDRRPVRAHAARRPADMSWLYLPADPVLRAHAADVERELRHVLRRPWRTTRTGSTSARAARDRARLPSSTSSRWSPTSRRPRRCPCSAVPPPSRRWSCPRRVRRAREDEADGGLPAFQRRAILRDKRHRLVGDLGRRDGRSHRDINAWLNRECGIGRVDDATIDQLQQSVGLLLDALTRR